ncbi:MAG: hypothetical protein WA118_08265 [Carboxydocellales bacterium]
MKLEDLRGRTIQEEKTGTNKKSAPKIDKVKRPFSEVLKEKELGIIGRETEKCFLFDSSGSIILEKEGATDHINFTPSELMKFNDNTFTHNHPGGTSLSPADIAVATTWNLKEIRAVGSQYKYSVVRPPQGWSRDDWDNTIKPAVDKYDFLVKQKFTKAIRDGELSIPDAEMRHWHEVWTRVSRELGLDYKRESW